MLLLSLFFLPESMSTGALKTAAVYICATRQHIGKSSVCMGAVSGLKRRVRNVGFMKPVGQRHEVVVTGSTQTFA